MLFKADPKLLEDTSDWLSRKDRLNSGYSIRMYKYKKLDMAGDFYKNLSAKGAKGKTAVASLIEQLPEDKQLLLTDERRKLDVLPQDVGIGISQILPVVVGALDNGTSILMVEQPELHIHPGLQTTMGDLFISQIQKEGKTFIIETHSEHLLLRLLRRIRETNDGELPEGIDGLTPEQVSVNYVELTEDGLKITQIQISEDGDFNNKWPNGFFDERAKELF
jgi:predicted ATPase